MVAPIVCGRHRGRRRIGARLSRSGRGERSRRSSRPGAGASSEPRRARGRRGEQAEAGRSAAVARGVDAQKGRAAVRAGLDLDGAVGPAMATPTEACGAKLAHRQPVAATGSGSFG